MIVYTWRFFCQMIEAAAFFRGNLFGLGIRLAQRLSAKNAIEILSRVGCEPTD